MVDRHIFCIKDIMIHNYYYRAYDRLRYADVRSTVLFDPYHDRIFCTAETVCGRNHRSGEIEQGGKQMDFFDYALVKNPEYFCDKRLMAHSDHRYYVSVQEMEEGESSFCKSLNGLWKFHYARNYEATVKGFEKEDYCCKDWEDIYVPAHIQMEGYDVPQYANVQYPWEGHEDIGPGEIPWHFNPVASYVKYFNIPENMRGKRIFISFQGAESGLALWMNGHFAGYSEDSFTPSEFELTDYVKEGENKLAVQVFKWTSGSWCEDQDFYRFSGIYRDVYLYTVPEVHVRDLEIRATPDKSLDSGELEVKMNLWGAGRIRAVLSGYGEIFRETECLADTNGKISMSVKYPRLWSAETPWLYDLVIEVYDNEGGLQEVIPEKVGFRRFEMKNGIMMLNGRRIVFKGVNRHEFSSVTGRNVSEEELRQDLSTMKRNNINAVRTCHYPNSSMVYRLCDEYGLYLIDEVNLESHGSWDNMGKPLDESFVVPYNKPEWLNMMLDRTNSMYQRDKNHPSILIWSCGNESFGGKDIFEMSQFLRKADPSRLVHYEGVFRDRTYNETSDIESQMYTPVEKIREFLTKDDSKPFICCEYAHAMGNSCGAMHKYTDPADTEPKYQGGFIWDYIDQTIYKKDRYGREFQAYGGDFGERPTDYNFCANGIVYGGDRSESPKMQEVKYNYQGIKAEPDATSVIIKNKNLFINTDSYICKVTVARDGREIRRGTLETSVEPLGEKTYRLPFEKETLPGEYTVTVSFHLKEETIWAEAGYEIAFGQYVYSVEKEDKPVAQKKIRVIRNYHNLGVRGDEFEAVFSYLNGGLASYKYGGKEMIEAIPRPNFWRAPTDNDCGNLMPMRYSQWKIASMYLNHKDFRKGTYDTVLLPEVEEGEETVKITFTYIMPTNPVASCCLSYEVAGDGKIRTTLKYDPVKELGDMPEFGVMFKLNADYSNIEWYGLGAESTYADRKKGAKLGIYRSTVSESVERYVVPQECGAKEEVRWAKVTDRKGRGMLFEMDKASGPMMFSALPYTPHEMENAMHPYELPRIHYTVIRAAKAQMGVAGDDAWGACTHPEYLLNTDKEMTFSFLFKGL